MSYPGGPVSEEITHTIQRGTRYCPTCQDAVSKTANLIEILPGMATVWMFFGAIVATPYLFHVDPNFIYFAESILPPNYAAYLEWMNLTVVLFPTLVVWIGLSRFRAAYREGRIGRRPDTYNNFWGVSFPHFYYTRKPKTRRVSVA